MKRLILLVAILLVLGCGKRVEVEQKSDIDGYCTHEVVTKVWVLDGWLMPDYSLIYREVRWGIHEDDLEVVEQIEYKKAQVVADRVRECLKQEGE